MALRRRDWYLQDWSREIILDENGRKRKVWKYDGEYFSFELSPKGLQRLKIAYVSLTVLMTAVWFIFSMTRTAGREIFYVGAEWFLCIIPFMELLMGAGCFIPLKEKMTYRAMYASYKRCTFGGYGLLILLSLTIIGEIVFLILYGSQVNLLREAVWTAGALLCWVSDLTIVILLRRYPPMIV